METSSRECKKSEREKLRRAGHCRVKEVKFKEEKDGARAERETMPRKKRLLPSWPYPHASVITTYLIWHVATRIKLCRKNPTAAIGSLYEAYLFMTEKVVYSKDRNESKKAGM